MLSPKERIEQLLCHYALNARELAIELGYERPQILYEILQERTQEISLKLAYGGAQPNISGKTISDFALPLPPLAEQERIVGKVEELFAVLDALQ